MRRQQEWSPRTATPEAHGSAALRLDEGVVVGVALILEAAPQLRVRVDAQGVPRQVSTLAVVLSGARDAKDMCQ